MKMGIESIPSICDAEMILYVTLVEADLYSDTASLLLLPPGGLSIDY